MHHLMRMDNIQRFQGVHNYCKKRTFFWHSSLCVSSARPAAMRPDNGSKGVIAKKPSLY